MAPTMPGRSITLGSAVSFSHSTTALRERGSGVKRTAATAPAMPCAKSACTRTVSRVNLVNFAITAWVQGVWLASSAR